MAFNKDKALKEAEKLVAKGKDKEAVALYKDVVKNDPRDLNTLNKLGDLQQKIGDKAAAIETFAQIADKYANDGFNLRAIAMYKKCQRVDPARIEFVEKLADLNAQQGLINEAKLNFTQVAEHYLKAGQAQKARQVYARIAEIEPDNLKNRLKLADLYLKDSQVKEALGEYQVIGAELVKKGMLDEALQVLEKALGLDPNNLQILRALATTRVDAGRAEEAVNFVKSRLEQKGGNDPDLLVVLGETFQAARAFDPARQCFDRALQLAPARTDVRQALYRLSVALNDADAAYSHYDPLVDGLVAASRGAQAVEDLKAILRVRDSHVPTLERIVRIHVETSADMKVQSDWMSRLSDAYIAAGRNAEAERVLARLVQMEPDVSQHGEKLEFVRLKLRQGAPAAAPAAAAGGGFGGFGAPAAPAAAPQAGGFGFGAPAATAEETSFGGLGLAEPESSSFSMSFDDDELESGRGDDRSEFIAERTAEADVFVKYGLVDKAIDQLQSIVARFADDVATRTRLASLLADEGKQSEAVEQWLAIAEIHGQSGNASAQQEAVANARRILPTHPALARFGGAPAAPAAAAPPAPAAPAEFSFGGFDAPAAPAMAGGFEISLDEGESAGGFSFGAPATPAPPAAPPPAASFDFGAPAAPAAAASNEFEISVDGGEEEMDVSLDAGDDAFAAPAAATPGGFALGPGGGDEFEISVDADAEEVVEIEGDAGFDPATPSAEPAEEAGFAFGAPEPEPEPAPAFEPPPAPVAEPAPVASSAPAPAAAAHAEDDGLFGAEDDFFNFADELNKELESAEAQTDVSRANDDQMMTLEQIVSGIQRGVAAQVDREDYETHYNLGIAYKEMGLLDEAIAEFQYSSKDQSRLLQCCILLGACFSEKGMPELAVTWYEKGKASPGITEEDRMALDYEIALCHEATGEKDKALKSLMQIYAQDARYRDVAQRMARLKAG